MEIRHYFCPLHKVAYNGDLDPTCPQCVLAGHLPPEQLEFDVNSQRPLNASGKPLNPRTLQEVG
jgi:hypothetical protein